MRIHSGESPSPRPGDWRRLVVPLVALATAVGVGLPVLASPAAAADPDLPLSGTVAGPGGAPVPGATVVVLSHRGEDPVASTTTAVDGTYGLTDLPDGGYRVIAVPPADDPLLLGARQLYAAVAEDGDVVDFELRVSNVRGVLTHADGTPAAGSVVEAYPDQSWWEDEATITHADGSFRLSLEGELWQLQGFPPATNPDLDVAGRRDVTVGTAAEPAVADFSLRRPNLRGTVVAPDGATAVAGARVTLWDWEQGDVRRARMTTRSDGSFGFSVPTGDYELEVAPPLTNPSDWVGTTVRPVTVTAAHNPGSPATQTVQLKGATLTGVIRDPDGNPVPGATVSAYQSASSHWSDSTTDALGRYAVEVTPGDVWIFLHRPGPTLKYLDRDFHYTVPELPHVKDFSFAAPTVVGRVVTADGLPVEGASVEAAGESTDPDAVTYADTNGKGRFALRLDQGAQQLHVDPPEERLDAAPTTVDIDVPAGGRTGLEVVLDRPVAPAYDLERLPVMLDGGAATTVQDPVLSADGNVLVVRAERGGMCDCELPGDYQRGLFVHERSTGTTEPLAAPDGTTVDHPDQLALSRDGQRIAVVTDQNDLVPGDVDRSTDVFVIDRAADTIVRIAPPPPDETGELMDPEFVDDRLALSGDGRRVALVMERTDPETWWEVYDVVVVTLDATGGEVSREIYPGSIDNAIGLAISRDGSTVAWTGFLDGAWGLHVLDVASGTEDPVRPFYPGADRWQWQEEPPALAGDGSRVAYVTYADVPREGGGFDWRVGVRLADRTAGTATDVPLFEQASHSGREVHDLHLSDDGSALGLRADRPDHDDSWNDNGWLIDLEHGGTTLVSRKPNGRPADTVEGFAMAGDPSVMALAMDDFTAPADTEASQRVFLALGESTPPEWPDDASVTADPAGIGTTSVRLSWSEATDDQAVVGYRVYRNGELAGTTSGDTRTLRVAGLAPDTSYGFTVQAVDGRGSESTDGPATTARTRPETTTELRPLDAESRPGGVVRLAWEAATGVDELVVRSYLGDAQVDEVAVPADATGTELAGLAAGATWTFQVFTRSGDAVTPYTQRVESTTPELYLNGLTWTTPMVRTNVARRGGTADLTAVAEPGRTVTVAVTYDTWYDDAHQLLDRPRSMTAVVPLAEVDAAPGTYKGTFELVDGISRIAGMTGTVADGHGGEVQRSATRPSVRVGGTLLVTVDAPAGGLAEARLQLGADSVGAWYSQAVTGGEVLALGHLESADDYQVSVVDPVGVAGRVTGVSLRDGLATAVELRPTLAAHLEVTVRGPDGGPVPVTTRVEATDADTGQWVGSQTVPGTGTVSFGRLREGRRLAVRVLYPRPSLLEDTDREPITLAPGRNTLAVAAVSALRGRVAGVVTDDAGVPIPAAQVTLAQWRGWESHAFDTVTAADGSYRLAGLASTGTLIVRSGQLREQVEVELGDTPVTRDVVLAGPRTYDVTLRLFTRSPGAAGETGPVPIDWRTAVHYGMSLQAGGYAPGRWWVADDGTSTTTVYGSPGDRVVWCIRGSEAHLAPTCVDTELPPGDRLTLEMHAGPVTPVTWRAVDGSGTAVSGTHAQLFRVGGEGRQLVWSGHAWSSTGRADAPAPGDYVLEVSAGDRSAARGFTVADQAQVELGDVVLRRRTHFVNDTNAVVTSRRHVLPGSQVEMRATWRNTGPDLAGVVARITVPTNAAFVAHSLLLDGEPVVGEPGDGYVDVTVGAVPAGAAGTLHYRLRPGAETAGEIPGRVEMRYGAGETAGAEPLAPTSARVAALTILGPGEIASDRLPLSGRAPAGAVVTIVDNGVPVGQALAGPGGLWNTAVTLTKQATTQSHHQVVAEAVLDGQRLSARLSVTVDETLPVATRVSLFQEDAGLPNGRRFTFDPRDGVARFPFVFVPNQPTVVEVTYDEPGLVNEVGVLIGDLRVPATRRADGTFVARTTTSRVSGPIQLDVDADPKPVDPATLAEPPVAEIRRLLPPQLQGGQISDVVWPDGSGPGPYVGAFTTTIPDVPAASARMTVTVTPTTYTPTDEDLADQRASGVPAWDAHLSAGDTSISGSMVVPVSGSAALGRVSARGSAVPLAAVGLAAASGQMVARVGFEIAFNGVSSLDSILSSIGSGEKYQKLSALVDRAARECPPSQAQFVTEQAGRIARDALVLDGFNAVMTVGGLAMSGATMGMSLSFWAIGYLADKAFGWAIDNRIQGMHDFITEVCKPEDDPVADPTWIYDPSGFTYEGARSARLGGVTATLLQGESADGPWTTWDAEWFGQINPQPTDDAGRYGWDVPEGWWRVAYTRDGYETAYSRVMQVLPPHLDVDVSMVKDGFPHVTTAALANGGIDVGFDRLVRSRSTVQEGAVGVTDAAGQAVAGAWTAVGPAPGDDAVALQRGLRFVPDTPFAAGTGLTLTVQNVADHAGKVMADPYTVELTVAGTPTDPGDPGGPGDPPTGATVPAAPTGVAAVAGERQATVSWTAPDDGGSPITGYLVTVLPTGTQHPAAADATELVVTALGAGAPYRFTVTATNAVGTGPASEPSAEVVPTAVPPDTELLTGPEQGSFTTTRGARLSWGSSDPVAGYVCTLDGRARECGADGLRLTRLPAGTHVFTVAARDGEGDVDPTPARRSWTVPRNDRVLDAGRGWHRGRAEAAYQGTYLSSRRRGAELTSPGIDVRRLALVATVGPQAGSVVVFLGRHRLGRFDLSAPERRRRVVVPVASFGGVRSGQIRVVVRSRGKPVVVEGLGVENWFPTA